MATMKKSKAKDQTESKFRTKINRNKSRGRTVNVSLPTEPTTPSTDLRDYTILIHGEKKIGKTTLFAQEEGAFFLEFDPKQGALSIYQCGVNTWPEFLAYVKLLEADAKKKKPRFQTVIIDGVDIAYDMCFDWKCKQLGIVHPHDEDDWGRSWKEIKKEFASAMRRVLKLETVAARFICHSKWVEQKTRGGGKVEKLVPLLAGQAEEMLIGEIDLWGAYVYDGPDRCVIISGDEETGAGHRIDGRFRTPKGENVVDVPMGENPKEGYVNMQRAFDNKQPWATLEAMRETEERETKRAKKKPKAGVKVPANAGKKKSRFKVK